MHSNIPKYVKIHGHSVFVEESPRGFVRVGLTLVSMDEDLKKKINNMDFQEHIAEWESAMYDLFKQAYKSEKERRKNMRK